MKRIYSMACAAALAAYGASAQDPEAVKKAMAEDLTKIQLDAALTKLQVIGMQGGIMSMIKGAPYSGEQITENTQLLGDGTRIPMIVVSKYTKPGHISHSYADHVSVLKFIERNWNLGKISDRSRDNLPNPTMAPGNPYVPTNRPAIADLFDLFQFP